MESDTGSVPGLLPPPEASGIERELTASVGTGSERIVFILVSRIWESRARGEDGSDQTGDFRLRRFQSFGWGALGSEKVYT